VSLAKVAKETQDRMGGEWNVEPLFQSADRSDNSPDLGTFFLARLPGMRMSDLPNSPYDWAYAVRDRDKFFRSVEPDSALEMVPVAQPTDLESAFGTCFLDERLGRSLPLDWSKELMQVMAAWELVPPPGGARQGEGIKIGHLDTGYADHAAWQPDALVLDQAWDVVKGTAGAIDPLESTWMSQGGYEHPGHGTATGSVIVGRGTMGTVTGVAPKARLVPIRCTRSVLLIHNGSDVARAIEYAVNSGCHVISMSLGGLPRRSLQRAVNYAVARNVLVLAAAGNCVGYVVAPAVYRNCIAVAAVNRDELPWIGSCCGSAVDIASPGEFVWCASRKPDDVMPDGCHLKSIRPAQGTSFAVANVAGIAALWLAHHGRDRLIDRYGGTSTLQSVFVRLLSGSSRHPARWTGGLYGAGIAQARDLLTMELPTAVSELEVLPSVQPAGDDYRSLVRIVLGDQTASRELSALFGADTDPLRTESSHWFDMFGVELLDLSYKTATKRRALKPIEGELESSLAHSELLVPEVLHLASQVLRSTIQG